MNKIIVKGFLLSASIMMIIAIFAKTEIMATIGLLTYISGILTEISDKIKEE